MKSQNELNYENRIAKFMSYVTMLQDGDPENESPKDILDFAEQCFEDIYQQIINEKDESSISQCAKCGCTTVIPKDDGYVCERCGVRIV